MDSPGSSEPGVAPGVAVGVGGTGVGAFSMLLAIAVCRIFGSEEPGASVPEHPVKTAAAKISKATKPE